MQYLTLRFHRGSSLGISSEPTRFCGLVSWNIQRVHLQFHENERHLVGIPVSFLRHVSLEKRRSGCSTFDDDRKIVLSTMLIKISTTRSTMEILFLSFIRSRQELCCDTIESDQFIFFFFLDFQDFGIIFTLNRKKNYEIDFSSRWNI